MVFKPFKVGDYIEGPDVNGTVKEIQIFHTILSTLDNRMIYVPNGILNNNAITNYSKQETRRVDWVFGVEYGEEIGKSKGCYTANYQKRSTYIGYTCPTYCSFHIKCEQR